MNKILKYIFTLIYFIAFAYIVFFSRQRFNITAQDVEKHLNLIPLINTFNWFIAMEGYPENFQWHFYSNFFGNILLMIPFPSICLYVLGIYRLKYIILTGILISCLIELIQWYLSIGIPDIDDVILNSTGVLIGSCILFFSKREKSKPDSLI